MTKLDYVCNCISPSLKKDPDLIIVEKFKRMSCGKNARTNSKYELIKFMQSSKEQIGLPGIPSDMTYERLA